MPCLTQYLSQPPFRGSAAADYGSYICEKAAENKFPYKYLAWLSGCADDGTPYDGMTSLRDEDKHPDLKAKYAEFRQTVQENASGCLCGTSPIGLASPSSIMKAAALLVFGRKTSDGVVALDSCNKDLADMNWGNSYKNDFYEAAVNHGEFTPHCRLLAAQRCIVKRLGLSMIRHYASSNDR